MFFAVLIKLSSTNANMNYVGVAVYRYTPKWDSACLCHLGEIYLSVAKLWVKFFEQPNAGNVVQVWLNVGNEMFHGFVC